MRARIKRHTDAMPLSAYTLYAWRVLIEAVYGLAVVHVWLQ